MTASTGRKVRDIRAYVVRGGGADYHDQASGHWIDTLIRTPMSIFPEYRKTRSSWGLNVLGSVVVEVEDDHGETGIGVSTGGMPAAWIVEAHLARFVRGAPVGELERVWEALWRSTLFYGRKGLAVNALSAVDLALWDLWGRATEQPVHELLGGALRREIEFYATGPAPARARQLGFLGAKVPLLDGPLEDELLRLAAIRATVGPDYPLMLDCWMSLTLDDATVLLDGVGELDFRWLEEALVPDDYWGYAELRRRRPPGTLIATGEHEAGLLGFRLLLEHGCADVLQPDISWCGGMTELRRIAKLAGSHGIPVVPHGSSVYSYHFMSTQDSDVLAEFLMMHPAGEKVVPMFAPLLLGEPVPENGRMAVSDAPGFGVELNRALEMERPLLQSAPT